MNRAATLLLALLVYSGVAQPKDLTGVFEDALRNDPVIRQADANRMAAREARPQAWSAVLPQLNATAGVTRDHNAGFQDQINEVVNPSNPNGPPILVVLPESAVQNTTTKQWGVNLKQNIFSWANWMALKEAGREVAQAEATYQAAQQQLILRVAQAYFNVLAAEDGLEAQPDLPRSHLAPARPGGQALRSRTHRHYRRAGGQGGARHGGRGRHRRQAHAGNLGRSAAGDHRGEIRPARQARHRHAAQEPRPGG